MCVFNFALCVSLKSTCPLFPMQMHGVGEIVKRLKLATCVKNRIFKECTSKVMTCSKNISQFLIAPIQRYVGRGSILEEPKVELCKEASHDRICHSGVR